MKRSCPVLIVAGDRDNEPAPPARDMLVYIMEYLNPQLVVHGGGGATDNWAGAAAKTHGRVVRVFNADWLKGPMAGPIRNREMAQFARDQGGGYVILFPGGRGTLSMSVEAGRAKLSIIDLRLLDGRKEEQSSMF